jgi:hypothetical protein
MDPSPLEAFRTRCRRDLTFSITDAGQPTKGDPRHRLSFREIHRVHPPPTIIEQIEFCENHNPVWTAAPAAVGLNAAQCTALDAATANARVSYYAAQVIRAQSKSAILTQNANAAVMRGQIADLIRQIKAFAELQSNPNAIYAMNTTRRHRGLDTVSQMAL